MKIRQIETFLCAKLIVQSLKGQMQMHADK